MPKTNYRKNLLNGFSLGFKSMVEGNFVNSRVLIKVKEAGKLALSISSQGLETQQKSSKEDFVTQGDLVVTEHLKSALAIIFGDIVFIDEETISTHDLNLDTDKLVAIIDPIDGTGNYYKSYINSQKQKVERKDEAKNWGISIGFMKDGKIVGGIIYQPELDKMFYAEQGRGAFMNENRLKTSTKDVLENSQPYFDFPYPHDKSEYDQTQELINKMEIYLHTKKPIKLSSQVIEIMKIAEGEGEFFFHLKTKPWDIAAALSIISEADGRYTDISGGPYNLFGENIIFDNGQIDLTDFYRLAT